MVSVRVIREHERLTGLTDGERTDLLAAAANRQGSSLGQLWALGDTGRRNPCPCRSGKFPTSVSLRQRGGFWIAQC